MRQRSGNRPSTPQARLALSLQLDTRFPRGRRARPVF